MENTSDRISQPAQECHASQPLGGQSVQISEGGEIGHNAREVEVEKNQGENNPIDDVAAPGTAGPSEAASETVCEEKPGPDAPPPEDPMELLQVNLLERHCARSVSRNFVVNRLMLYLQSCRNSMQR